MCRKWHCSTNISHEDTTTKWSCRAKKQNHQGSGSHNDSRLKATHEILAEAANTACYTQNHTLIHKHFDKTSYEIWTGRTPNISYFHIFGCRVFIHNNRKTQLKTIEGKADEGVFLGYSSFSKAYQVLNRRTLVVEELPHVVFDESSCKLSL